MALMGIDNLSTKHKELVGGQVLFSVIIPVYNKEQYVEKTIESVINQTYLNFEIIVVCDPSTDNSTLKVKKFTDNRIKILFRNEPGPGGYAARNLGIDNARGKWIAFLDADDEWRSDHLQLASSYINKYNIKFISFAFEVIGEAKNRDSVRKVSQILAKKSQKEILTLMEKRDIFHTNSVIIEKKIIDQSGCFPDSNRYKRGGDIDTWLRIVLNLDYVLFSPIVTSSYNFAHSGVISNKRNSLAPQPVVDTVRRIVNSNLLVDNEILRSVKILSNRKQINLLHDRKKIRMLNFGDFKYIFVFSLSIVDSVKIVSYFLPLKFYNYFYRKIKK
jgi:glycosyltransferase involved in cell wall biosynthesis